MVDPYSAIMYCDDHTYMGDDHTVYILYTVITFFVEVGSMLELLRKKCRYLISFLPRSQATILLEP